MRSPSYRWMIPKATRTPNTETIRPATTKNECTWLPQSIRGRAAIRRYAIKSDLVMPPRNISKPIIVSGIPQGFSIFDSVFPRQLLFTNHAIKPCCDHRYLTHTTASAAFYSTKIQKKKDRLNRSSLSKSSCFSN